MLENGFSEMTPPKEVLESNENLQNAVETLLKNFAGFQESRLPELNCNVLILDGGQGKFRIELEEIKR